MTRWYRTAWCPAQQAQVADWHDRRIYGDDAICVCGQTKEKHEPRPDYSGYWIPGKCERFKEAASGRDQENG